MSNPRDPSILELPYYGASVNATYRQQQYYPQSTWASPARPRTAKEISDSVQYPEYDSTPRITHPSSIVSSPALAHGIAGLNPHSLSKTWYGLNASQSVSNPQAAVEKDTSTLLHSEFRVRPSKFFKTGKVFLTLWTESGQSGIEDTASGKAWSRNEYGEWVYTKARRFVVVREGAKACTALPITTYNGQGVAKRGLDKSDHAIVHTGKQIPTPSSGELPTRGEFGMLPAIRVDPDSQKDQLDSMSRIDFAKPQTIHHYVKVRSVGMVHKDSKVPLLYQFQSKMTVRAHFKGLLPPTTELDRDGEKAAGLCSNEHTDVQECATRVASFFRDNGLLQDAIQLEQRMLQIRSTLKQRKDPSDRNGDTDDDDDDDDEDENENEDKGEAITRMEF